jgi:hypothetical protein
MAQFTYTFLVRLPNGTTQKIGVQADSESNARAMLQAQYGKDKVSSLIKRS